MWLGLPASVCGSGWKPLCEFLGHTVPAEDYPHVNKTEDFQNRMREIAKQNADG